MTVIFGRSNRHVVIPAMTGVRVHTHGGGAWTAAGWWDVEGKTCVAAYQAKGAASYAASLSNLANPGTYDLTEVAAPDWATGTGWTFDSADRLNTGYAFSANNTVIVRFTPASNGHTRKICTTTSEYVRVALTRDYTNVIKYIANGNANGSSALSDGTSYVVALANGKGYLDGSSDATIGSPSSNNGTMNIGAYNASDTTAGSIAAFAMYSSELSGDEISALSTAMAAL